MDIESLAKELILKNMNPEQQLAVLDGIKASARLSQRKFKSNALARMWV